MESAATNGLVTVSGSGPDLDGIVFDSPSRTKVVVAVVDPSRGPVFRTVHPAALAEREQEGPHDQALWLLIRRTPAPGRNAGRGGAGGAQGRTGHTRAANHRTTGR